MSSLQCPATLLLTPAPTPDSTDLATRVEHRRVATVWCGTEMSTRRTSEVVAERLGCPVEVRDGLDPLDPDESSARATERLREVLQEVADLHRGETVLVLTDAELVVVAVPRLAPPPGRPTSLAAGGLVELEVDEEWRCHSWETTPEQAPGPGPRDGDQAAPPLDDAP